MSLSFCMAKRLKMSIPKLNFLAMKEKLLIENQLEPIILETIILFSDSHSF